MNNEVLEKNWYKVRYERYRDVLKIIATTSIDTTSIDLANKVLYKEFNVIDDCPLENFREWILVNYEPAITSLIEKTVIPHGKVNGWDEVSVDEMLEELHFELKKSLLNVIDTYLK